MPNYASQITQIKLNQIALLAKAPSTGLQLPNMEKYNAYKQEV